MLLFACSSGSHSGCGAIPGDVLGSGAGCVWPVVGTGWRRQGPAATHLSSTSNIFCRYGHLLWHIRVCLLRFWDTFDYKLPVISLYASATCRKWYRCCPLRSSYLPFLCLNYFLASGVDTHIWPVWRWQVERTTWVWRGPSLGPSCSASLWWPPTSTVPCWWVPALHSPRQCSRPGLSTRGKYDTWNKIQTQQWCIFQLFYFLSH